MIFYLVESVLGNREICFYEPHSFFFNMTEADLQTLPSSVATASKINEESGWIDLVQWQAYELKNRVLLIFRTLKVFGI